MKTSVNLAIFASGNGSNAENIVKYFTPYNTIRVDSIFTNKVDAYVLERANRLDIPSFYFNNTDFRTGDRILEILHARHIDYIILAGFLLKIPSNLIMAYPQKIINIHPALLPKYGGKGMYGDNVHRAVKEAGESKSGISIHLVNEHYDDGAIIFQAQCKLEPSDTISQIAAKVHKLEYQYFPIAIEDYINKQNFS